MSEYTTVARLSELPEGRGHQVELNGEQLALFKINGEVLAISNICPHKQAPLAFGWVEKGKVFCAMHGWDFDLRTGFCSVAPGKPVDCYSVRVVGDEVQIGPRR